MSIVLNIDTAGEDACLSIAADGEVLADLYNTNQKEHSSSLQIGIEKLLKKAGITIQMLDAIAVAAGPGSYTGLRIGMASAKGLCFALNKPLITVGTLEIMAAAALAQMPAWLEKNDVLYCPMIDARRMEVFTALYNNKLEMVSQPEATIVDETIFANWLLKFQVVFFGNGAGKCKGIIQHPNAVFYDFVNNGLAMSKLSFAKFTAKNFADVAYSEPLYLKEFYTNIVLQ